MISTKDAIRVGRALLGTPYAELDCINLIKAIIRRAPGGVPGYTTAGTNSLWASYDSAPKYRDLTWRQEGIAGAKAGMLAFQRSGSDVHHVGLVTGEGTVLHSSSALGCVVETALAGGQWALLAIHRYIEASPLSSDGMPSGSGTSSPEAGGLCPPPPPNGGSGDGDSSPEADTGEEDKPMAVLYQATVNTDRDPLRVRDYPVTGGIVGHAPRGATVDVLSEEMPGWPRIRFGELVGYASGAYLRREASPLPPNDGSGDGSSASEAGDERITIPLADARAIYEALSEAQKIIGAALGVD